VISLRTTLATARRVLTQLRRDHRTTALLLVVPSMLMILLRYVFADAPQVFDRIGLPLLGVFPFVTMFLVTSVAMLRERTSGTLERLLTTPLHKLDLLLGYGIAFAVAAALQAGIATVVAYRFLGLETAGSAWLVVGVAIANAVLGMSVGLFVSAFAQSEFQAVQFMPAVALPQVLLCGLLAPRDEMAGWLQAASDVMPMTYAVDALTEIGAHGELTGALSRDVTVVAGAAVAFLVLGAATLRRRTP
jgi:ABC-2 type transport system permease protein